MHILRTFNWKYPACIDLLQRTCFRICELACSNKDSISFVVKNREHAYYMRPPQLCPFKHKLSWYMVDILRCKYIYMDLISFKYPILLEFHWIFVMYLSYHSPQYWWQSWTKCRHAYSWPHTYRIWSRIWYICWM